MDTFRSMPLASFLVAALVASSSAFAQQSSAAPAAPVTASAAGGSVVPHLVNYSGVLQDAGGKPITAIRGVTFLLYREAQGGAPVWMETQNVTPDKSGHYTVQLGTTGSQGLPPEMFITGAARWLAVQVSGEAEQARVLLVSAPYALKASDADTIGGLPPSAFVLAAPVMGGASSTSSVTAPGSSVPPPLSSNVTTTGGTVNAIPLFTTATNIQNSAITQTGSGATAKIGIGIAAPAAALDIKGGEYVRGALTMPSTGTATAAKAANSQPEVMIASVFNSGTSTAVNQKFQLQAEPAGNNTATASGTLNLLYGSGTATPAETGMKINSKGQIIFATGQTFPGTGTVKSVGLTAPASDFTVGGSPVTTTGALNLGWNVAPDSADTANAIVKRDSTGSFNVTNIYLSGEFLAQTPSSNAIAGVTSSDGGSAIVGLATAPGGVSRVYGVVGKSFSTVAGSTGVLGEDENTTDAGGFTMGMQGGSSNPIGIGVLGFDGPNLSAEFSHQVGRGVGVWGDGGPFAKTITAGVMGTNDYGYAGFFSNDADDYTALIAVANGNNSNPFEAVGKNGACSIDTNGNFGCTGTKNAVVPIYGGKRKVAMSAIESPQNWFEDFGSAQLSNGSAVVALDPDFTETVNTSAHYMVIPVPNGECKGLYITHKTPVSFEVRELGGGTSNIAFDYRIVVLRKNYESVRFADHTNDPDPRKMMEEMKQRRKNGQQPTAVQAAPAASMQSALPRPAARQ